MRNMRNVKRLVALGVLIWIAIAANAATKTPGSQPDTVAPEFSHQVRVSWTPFVDASGRQVVRLSIEYTRSADTPAYDKLVVGVLPSNRVLVRVVDPDSAMADREKALEASGRSSALVTSYSKLEHYSQTVVLPYSAAGDERILIAVRRGDQTLVLARTKTNLSNPVTFTATTMDKRLTSPAFQRPGMIHVETTHYCYESDWCQPQCVYCDAEPTWDDWTCQVTCNSPPAGSDCLMWDECVYDPSY